jgi:uncharacterized RDD family membrane protein YckC
MSDTLQSMFENQPVEVPISEKRVGFGKRLGASVLNGFVFIILATILNLLFTHELQTAISDTLQEIVSKSGNELSRFPGGEEFFYKTMTWMIFYLLSVYIVGLMEVFIGQSPGKKILGLSVTFPDGNKGGIGLWALRWAIKKSSYLLLIVTFFVENSVLSILVMLLWFVNVLGCLLSFSSNKQALHDIIAKTAIYNTEDVR